MELRGDGSTLQRVLGFVQRGASTGFNHLSALTGRIMDHLAGEGGDGPVLGVSADGVDLGPEGRPRGEEVLWAQFDLVHMSCGEVRMCLVLCLLDGFQVWDITEPTAPVIVKSSREFMVSSAHYLPPPSMGSKKGKVALEKQRPLLALVYAQPRDPLRPYTTGLSSPTNRRTLPLYSLLLGEVVRTLNFPQDVITVSANPRAVVVGMMDYIEVLDARTLLTKHTLRSYRDTLEWGLLSLGTRWLAFASDDAPGGEGDIFVHPGDVDTSIKKKAVTAAKGMASKMYKYGHQAYSTYVKGEEETRLEVTPNAGTVMVVDLENCSKVCHFRAHQNPIANLQFNPNGRLLLTASVDGRNIVVWQINYGQEKPVRMLYKLNRGMTEALIRDIAFSWDSKWVAASSAHGTTHIFAINPEGGPITTDSHLPHHQREDSDESGLVRLSLRGGGGGGGGIGEEAGPSGGQEFSCRPYFGPNLPAALYPQETPVLHALARLRSSAIEAPSLCPKVAFVDVSGGVAQHRIQTSPSGGKSTASIAPSGGSGSCAPQSSGSTSTSPKILPAARPETSGTGNPGSGFGGASATSGSAKAAAAASSSSSSSSPPSTSINGGVSSGSGSMSGGGWPSSSSRRTFAGSLAERVENSAFLFQLSQDGILTLWEVQPKMSETNSREFSVLELRHMVRGVGRMEENRSRTIPHVWCYEEGGSSPPSAERESKPNPPSSPGSPLQERWVSQVEVQTHSLNSYPLWLGPQFKFKTLMPLPTPSSSSPSSHQGVRRGTGKGESPQKDSGCGRVHFATDVVSPPPVTGFATPDSAEAEVESEVEDMRDMNHRKIFLRGAFFPLEDLSKSVAITQAEPMAARHPLPGCGTAVSPRQTPLLGGGVQAVQEYDLSDALRRAMNTPLPRHLGDRPCPKQPKPLFYENLQKSLSLHPDQGNRDLTECESFAPMHPNTDSDGDGFPESDEDTSPMGVSSSFAPPSAPPVSHHSSPVEGTVSLHNSGSFTSPPRPNSSPGLGELASTSGGSSAERIAKAEALRHAFSPQNLEEKARVPGTATRGSATLSESFMMSGETVVSVNAARQLAFEAQEEEEEAQEDSKEAEVEKNRETGKQEDEADVMCEEERPKEEEEEVQQRRQVGMEGQSAVVEGDAEGVEDGQDLNQQSSAEEENRGTGVEGKDNPAASGRLCGDSPSSPPLCSEANEDTDAGRPSFAGAVKQGDNVGVSSMSYLSQSDEEGAFGGLGSNMAKEFMQTAVAGGDGNFSPGSPLSPDSFPSSASFGSAQEERFSRAHTPVTEKPEFRSPVHVSEAEGDSEGPLQESEDSGWITAGNQKGTAPLPPLQLQESEGPDAGESVASEEVSEPVGYAGAAAGRQQSQQQKQQQQQQQKKKKSPRGKRNSKKKANKGRKSVSPPPSRPSHEKGGGPNGEGKVSGKGGSKGAAGSPASSSSIGGSSGGFSDLSP